MSALPVSAALSIIQAVIKVRGQVDTIMSVHKAADQLPFLLPDVPGRKDRAHRKEMMEYFKSPDGTAMLTASGKEADFLHFVDLHTGNLSPENEMGSRSSELYSIFFTSTGTQPEFVGGPRPDAGAGADRETLIAWFSVHSGRLSKSPVGMRLTLAVAGTLLEVAGANAGLFVRNPATKQVVETLVERFVTGVGDDAGLDEILKGLVVAVVSAANGHPALTQNMPALKPLIGALADVCAGADNLKARDFVAGLVSAAGFERLLSGYLSQVAADPSLVTDNKALQSVLAVTLTELSAKVPLISRDPKNLVAVLGTGLAEALRNAPALLEGRIDGSPVLSLVITTLAAEVSSSAAPFFQRLAPVNLLPSLYRAALRKIAADPALVAGAGECKQLLRELVRDVAGAIAELEPAGIFSTETLRVIAAKGIETLGDHPELLTGNQEAAAGTLAIVFKTGAAALKDLRVTPDELTSLAKAVVAMAAAHPGIAKFDAKFAAVLPAISSALLASDLKSLLTPQSWRDVLLAAMEAVVAHPAVWKELRERELLQPLATAIVGGLARGDGLLLAGLALAGTLQNLLLLVALRGRLFLDERVRPRDVEIIIRAAIASAGLAGDSAIDLRSLPRFVGHVLAAFLQKLVAADDAAAVAALIGDAAATFNT